MLLFYKAQDNVFKCVVWSTTVGNPVNQHTGLKKPENIHIEKLEPENLDVFFLKKMTQTDYQNSW